MYSIVLAIHYVLCLFLIAVVLLQQGRGADVGAALGGGSNTLFGASGASSLLSRITVISAILFMLTSILLVKHYPVNFLSSGPVDVMQGSVVDKVAGEKSSAENGAEGSTSQGAPATDSKTSAAASAVAVPPQAATASKVDSVESKGKVQAAPAPAAGADTKK